jgi:phage-related baseplate assembly protein
MARRFADIDLSTLPDLPLGAETYDAIYTARMGEIADRLNAVGIPYDVTPLATDTYALTEGAGAYRELLVYAARDEAVRSVLLATSRGVWLDYLGAQQVPPVVRLVLVPATEQAAAVMEGDEPFRQRIQLAPEALSTCGPEGAYLYFALSVDGVKTATPYGPMSFGGTPDAPFTPLGCVDVPIVAAAGDGTASPALVAAVAAALSADLRRPLADFVRVSPAVIVPYEIEAVLKVGPGTDAANVQAAATRRLRAQADRQHRPGAAQLRQMLFGAAYVTDATGAIVVEEVDLRQPAADVNAASIVPGSPAAAYRAPYCSRITVTVEVDDG